MTIDEIRDTAFELETLRRVVVELQRDVIDLKSLNHSRCVRCNHYGVIGENCEHCDWGPVEVWK